MKTSLKNSIYEHFQFHHFSMNFFLVSFSSSISDDKIWDATRFSSLSRNIHCGSSEGAKIAFTCDTSKSISGWVESAWRGNKNVNWMLVFVPYIHKFVFMHRKTSLSLSLTAVLQWRLGFDTFWECLIGIKWNELQEIGKLLKCENPNCFI